MVRSVFDPFQIDNITQVTLFRSTFWVCMLEEGDLCGKRNCFSEVLFIHLFEALNLMISCICRFSWGFTKWGEVQVQKEVLLQNGGIIKKIKTNLDPHFSLHLNSAQTTILLLRDRLQTSLLISEFKRSNQLVFPLEIIRKPIGLA